MVYGIDSRDRGPPATLLDDLSDFELEYVDCKEVLMDLDFKKFSFASTDELVPYFSRSVKLKWIRQ